LINQYSIAANVQNKMSSDLKNEQDL
jgi:hypothetical protein